MNFKSRADYQEHVEYCTDQMYSIITNYESDYLFLQRIMKKNLSIRAKAGILREAYKDYPEVGRYTRFTAIIKREMEE